MKNNEFSQDKLELAKQTEAEKQRVLVGTLKPQKNHILFEFNLTEKTLQKAEFKVDKELSFTDAQKGLVSQRKEVDGKEGCIYVSAMNEKNAWKKLLNKMRQ